MLVLTRKYQEKIRIGENITITVLRTKGKAVRLGIEAPADVPVIRGELTFQNESEPAAATSGDDEGPVEVAVKPLRASGATTGTRWATEREAAGKVSLSRLPRGKVADVLPRLISGDAPLRVMMDQRTVR
jgi:carbon storage regulator